MTNAGIVDELAPAGVDLKASGTQDLQSFLEGIRALALRGGLLAAQRFAANRSRAGGSRPGFCAARGRNRGSLRGRAVGIQEFDFVGFSRGATFGEARGGSLVRGRCARALLRTHRHHRYGGEVRAHVLRDLPGGVRVAEESEPQAVPFAPVAIAFHRIERIGAEDCKRRNLLERHRIH